MRIVTGNSQMGFDKKAEALFARFGWPMSGTIGIAMIVEAASALELDELIENLPIWPRMETSESSRFVQG